MSRFLRRRSSTATPTVSSPPPAANHHSQERVMSPEAEAQQVRLEVYLNHWQQIQVIVNKVFNNRRSWSKVNHDDVQTVANYTIQMMHLLVEEEAPAQGTIGRLLEILIQENILEKLYIWSERVGDYQEDAKRELLKIYELIIGQCKQSVLMHPAILNPLLSLLLACWEHSREDTERQLIPLLQALCISLSQDPNLLEFLFHASPSKGPAKFLLFSLLIPYIHREGLMGQQARDALLLCISVSAEAKNIGKYIADSTNLCPVLAGGLGALYSRLPGKLDISPDHWHRITQEDLANMPDLAMFLNSLEFCNAVVQVAHPLVSDQLVQFFHDGFLVPVIGPALHQFSHADILRNSSDLMEGSKIILALGGDADLFGAEETPVETPETPEKKKQSNCCLKPVCSQYSLTRSEQSRPDEEMPHAYISICVDANCLKEFYWIFINIYHSNLITLAFLHLGTNLYLHHL